MNKYFANLPHKYKHACSIVAASLTPFCLLRLPQVFSAICVVFAHGAGEVGYMAGPLGTIWAVYEEGKLPSKVNPPIWVILIGAIGLVIGLATYGANICRTVRCAIV